MKTKQIRNTLPDTYLDAVRIHQLVLIKGQGMPMSLEIDKDKVHYLRFVLYGEKSQAAATCCILPNKSHSEATL